MTRKTWTACTALAAAACGACGGALDRPVAQFPSKDELQQVVGRPASPIAPLDAVPTDRWVIETPIPPSNAAYPAETTWDQMLVQARARGSPLRLAPELRCAATETARYYAVQGGFPEDALRKYVLLRCGSTLGGATLRTLSLQVPEAMPDAKVQESFASGAREIVAQYVSRVGEVGLGFARVGPRAALVAYFGAPAGRLHDVPPIVVGKSVTLEGEAEPDAVSLMGLANQGSLGVARCELDPAIALPAFRLSCPFSEQDAQTVIEIAARRSNRVLMHVSARAMVRRAADAGLVYDVHTYGSVGSPAGVQGFRTALVEGINEARGKAGLPALTLESAESRDSDQLTLPYFQSAFGGNGADADTVALGLLAGWDVSGTIRDGGIFSGTVSGSRSAGRWLTEALATPMGRWSLLEPSMSRVAVGARLMEPSGALAIVTTYSLFESLDHRADENAVFAELTRVRLARGAQPPRRMPDDAALRSALAHIALHAQTSMEALQNALDRVVAEQQRPARGWVVETNDLRSIPFDGVLLAPGPIQVEVGVTHHKVPGGAWGQYAVIFMVIDNGPPAMTASLPGIIRR